LIKILKEIVLKRAKIILAIELGGFSLLRKGYKASSLKHFIIFLEKRDDLHSREPKENSRLTFEENRTINIGDYSLSFIIAHFK